MKLGQVLTYKKGKSPTRSIELNAEVLYLTPEYLRGKTDPTYVQDFPQKVNVLDGDLLLLWDGSNAGEFFKGKKGILASTMVLLNCGEEKIDREFLFYKLKGYEDYLKGQTNGSGIPHVDKEILQKLEIGEFEQVEQKKIANVLNNIDSGIENTCKLINKYRRIKSGLMQNLLTYGIDSNGNIRSKETHKFVIKNGIEVPEEWEVKTLKELCSLIQDGTHFSPPTEVNGEYMYLTSKNIRSGYLDLSNIEFINYNEHRKIYDSCSVKEGDVLLTKDGANTGNAALNTIKEEFSLLSSVCLLRGKNNVLDNKYLLYWILSENGQRKIKDSMSGLAITRITLTIINEFSIPVPSFEEQQIICNKIDTIYSVIDEQSKQLNKLNKLKTGLMQDLLNGKVRVKM